MYFLSYAYTGPVLSVILRANFEDAVDTAQDILDRNMTLVDIPPNEMWKHWLSQHENKNYNKLAETMIIAETWQRYDIFLEQDILQNRTHVIMAGFLSPFEISLGRNHDMSPRMKHTGRKVWYRSKERVDNFPYTGYLSRKDWRYNEEMTRVTLHFDQV